MGWISPRTWFERPSIYVGSRNLARGQAAVAQLEAAGVQARQYS